jgi:hypothetical protein
MRTAQRHATAASAHATPALGHTDKGLTPDRNKGRPRATGEGRKVFGSSVGIVPKSLLNEKSSPSVEFLFSIGRQHDA